MLLDVADVTTLLWHVVVFFSEGAVGRGCGNVITGERWLAVSMATTRTSATLRPSCSHAQRRCDSGEDLSVTPPTPPPSSSVWAGRETRHQRRRERKRRRRRRRNGGGQIECVWWEEEEKEKKEKKESQCERGSGKLTKLLRVGGDLFGDALAVTKRKCSKKRRLA